MNPNTIIEKTGGNDRKSDSKKCLTIRADVVNFSFTTSWSLSATVNATCVSDVFRISWPIVVASSSWRFGRTNTGVDDAAGRKTYAGLPVSLSWCALSDTILFAWLTQITTWFIIEKVTYWKFPLPFGNDLKLRMFLGIFHYNLSKDVCELNLILLLLCDKSMKFHSFFHVTISSLCDATCQQN